MPLLPLTADAPQAPRRRPRRELLRAHPFSRAPILSHGYARRQRHRHRGRQQRQRRNPNVAISATSSIVMILRFRIRRSSLPIAPSPINGIRLTSSAFPLHRHFPAVEAAARSRSSSLVQSWELVCLYATRNGASEARCLMASIMSMRCGGVGSVLRCNIRKAQPTHLGSSTTVQCALLRSLKWSGVWPSRPTEADDSRILVDEDKTATQQITSPFLLRHYHLHERDEGIMQRRAVRQVICAQRFLSLGHPRVVRRSD